MNYCLKWNNCLIFSGCFLTEYTKIVEKYVRQITQS